MSAARLKTLCNKMCLFMEEEKPTRNSVTEVARPLEGCFLDRRQVFVKDDEMVLSDGTVLNSCDALRIIDNVSLDVCEG